MTKSASFKTSSSAIILLGFLAASDTVEHTLKHLPFSRGRFPRALVPALCWWPQLLLCISAACLIRCPKSTRLQQDSFAPLVFTSLNRTIFSCQKCHLWFSLIPTIYFINRSCPLLITSKCTATTALVKVTSIFCLNCYFPMSTSSIVFFQKQPGWCCRALPPSSSHVEHETPSWPQRPKPWLLHPHLIPLSPAFTHSMLAASPFLEPVKRWGLAVFIGTWLTASSHSGLCSNVNPEMSSLGTVTKTDAFPTTM